MVYRRIKVYRVYLWLMDSERGSRRKLIAPDIPFTQTLQRCNAIWGRYNCGKVRQKGIVDFVAKFQNSQQLKVKHKSRGGLDENIELVEGMLQMIYMDSVTGLPRSRMQHDSIRVIIDRIKKSTHFLPINTTHSTQDYATLYIQKVVRIHGVWDSIILDRGAQFST